MPTLLGLTNLPKHPKLQGRNWAPVLRGEQNLADTDVGLLSAPVCSGPLQLYGLKAYRGIRTLQHTYVRNEETASVDNINDPFQKITWCTQQARNHEEFNEFWITNCMNVETPSNPATN